jgi:hypothetical protein
MPETDDPMKLIGEQNTRVFVSEEPAQKANKSANGITTLPSGRLTRLRRYETSHPHTLTIHGPTTEQVHQTQTPGRLPQAQENPR